MRPPAFRDDLPESAPLIRRGVVDADPAAAGDLMAWSYPKLAIAGRPRAPRGPAESRLNDGRAVAVEGDLERALRQLRRQKDAASLVEALQRHAAHRSRGERRRAKQRRAAARRRRAARRVGQLTGEGAEP